MTVCGLKSSSFSVKEGYHHWDLFSTLATVPMDGYIVLPVRALLAPGESQGQGSEKEKTPKVSSIVHYSLSTHKANPGF